MKNSFEYRIISVLIQFIIISLLTFTNIFSQPNPGAREIALSHSNIAITSNAFSIFNNPGGLSRFHTRELDVYYSPSPFGLKELANASAAYVEPFSFVSLGIGFTTYGFNLFRENKFALSISKLFYETFYFGITAIYQTIKIQNYGSDGIINLIVGGQAELTDNLVLGFAIENLLRSTYGKEKDQIPVIYKTGVSYFLLNNFILNFAIEKELTFPVAVKGGIEYRPIKYVSVRAGINNQPTSFSGGIGINYSFFHLDYSFNENQNLGLSHQFGLAIRINKN